MRFLLDAGLDFGVGNTHLALVLHPCDFLLHIDQVLWLPDGVIDSLFLAASLALRAPLEVVIVAHAALPATIWKFANLPLSNLLIVGVSGFPTVVAPFPVMEVVLGLTVRACPLIL
jgi:hypothetical protein